MCTVYGLYGFYATTTSSTSAAVNPYPYSAPQLNTDLSFNSVSANTYKCLQSGVYWIFMTVVWDGTTYAEFNLNGLGTTYPTPSVNRANIYSNNYDTTSRDFIRLLNQSQVLSTQSLYPTWADSITGSAWGLFQIDNLMSPVVSARITSLLFCTYNCLLPVS